MTKEVKVTIEGVQLEISEEAVITKASGSYCYRNGVHYIKYEEGSAKDKDITKNSIKISQGRIEIIKEGNVNTRMVFKKGETTNSVYQTKYGDLLFTIITSEMLVVEAKDKVMVKMIYSLLDKDSKLSDNQIKIFITSI